MADSKKNRRKMKRLRAEAKKEEEKMIAEWGFAPGSTGAGVCADYCQNGVNIKFWWYQQGLGENPSAPDLANYQRISAGFIKSLNSLKKTPEEIQIAEAVEAEAKAASEAVRTGDNVNALSDHFDPHAVIKAYKEAEWKVLLDSEAGKYGAYGKRWALSVRKFHRLIDKWTWASRQWA
ncbi:MAG: hypothetical protein WBC74_06020, partial [Candidatus Omnitrophota bacterium]